MLRANRPERGQVLVLFAVFFSSMLLLLAFAIDQGFWYGRRRVAQGDVDSVAREGAFGYFSGLDDEASARARALSSAAANAASGVEPDPDASSCDLGSTTVSGAPSITVQERNNVPGLFSRLPLIGGDNSGVEVGAEATACVGAVQALEVADIYDNSPDPGDNTLKSIPIALEADSSRSCFDGGSALDVGHECVLLGPLDETNDARLLFSTPLPTRCEGGPNANVSDIEDGIAYTCEVATGNGCSGNMTCVDIDRTDRDQQINAFFAMNERLDEAPGCDNSFSNAFGSAYAPPKFGGRSVDAGRVYVQSGCFHSHRIVVLPIVENQGGNSPRNVLGFTTVYLTGCYRDGVDQIDDPGEQARDCGTAAFLTWLFGFNDFEIRGVPINFFVTNDLLGSRDIGSPMQNSVLTIQTVQ
jgi:hypothetical protein